MTDTKLNADVVLALAAVAGIRLADADSAARIAVGAGTAIAAVRSVVTDTLFDHEPGDYLGTLEQLADSGAAAP